MLAKVFVYATIFASSALGAALPAVPSTEIVLADMGDTIALAQERGIDIFGPIPSDATPIEGGYSFEADSDAAYWVRAQSGLSNSGDLAKREFANIGMGLFTAAACRGAGVWFDNIIYDHQNVAPQNFLYYAFMTTGRAVRQDEQMDFSTRGGSDLCANFLNSYKVFGPNGCHDNSKITCFRLIHNSVRWTF